jgi:5S rRNA maturation endonuclease (ribonuclease M5)
MKLSSEDQRNAIRGMAEAEGCALEYHMPDKNAEAIYSYCDKEGWLVKQVLRFPGKQFTQKRFTSNGWSYSVADADPLLYHADRLIFTDTVAICEGEKDCDTVMGLSLWGTSGNELIATTSGSSNSWRDEFADDLLGKRVILMPDDDEAGARYADAIVASLESRGIEHRIVCFSDVGAKDVSEFLEQGHSKEELVERMGSDWVAASAPTIIEEPTVLEDA